MNSYRILILYITPHSGHHSAALSIQKAIQIIKPDAEVMTLDAFNYTNPILNKIVTKTYLHIVKRRPEVWEYLYDNPQIVFRAQKLKKLIHKYNSKKLYNLISKLNPDVVVSTQAFPCGMVADLKSYYNLSLPLVGVLTDYVAHSFWYYDNVDLYIVSDEFNKARMLQNGISDKKIKVYGIPIAPEFNLPLNKEEILENLGLDNNLPLVLIMGGGRGLGQIKQITFSLLRIESALQIVVVTGMNKRLYRYFRRKEKQLNKFKKVKVFPYVDNIYELMAVSDILISKPGGITTAEALAKRVPMIIFNPLPGQERSNAEFLLRIGAAIKSDTIVDLQILLQDLLENRSKLSYMKERAEAYSHPDSALRIASEILRI